MIEIIKPINLKTQSGTYLINSYSNSKQLINPTNHLKCLANEYFRYEGEAYIEGTDSTQEASTLELISKDLFKDTEVFNILTFVNINSDSFPYLKDYLKRINFQAHSQNKEESINTFEEFLIKPALLYKVDLSEIPEDNLEALGIALGDNLQIGVRNLEEQSSVILKPYSQYIIPEQQKEDITL